VLVAQVTSRLAGASSAYLRPVLARNGRHKLQLNCPLTALSGPKRCRHTAQSISEAVWPEKRLQLSRAMVTSERATLVIPSVEAHTIITGTPDPRR
jgi:hypothetical protein